MNTVDQSLLKMRVGKSLLRRYGVTTISRLLKSIGLFCKRALSKRRYCAKETCNFKAPTHRSHPIVSRSIMIENQDKGDEVMYKMYMGIHMYSHHICVVYMGIHMGWLRLVGSVCIPIYKGHEVMYKNHYGEDFCEDSQQIHHDLYCIMICIASYIMIENQDKGHVGMNTIPTCPSNHYGQDVSTNYYGQDF